MNLTEIVSVIASGLGGGALLKLAQVWLEHRRAIDGDFSLRQTAARKNFQIVVNHLEERLKMLEQSEEECRQRNFELEIKVRTLEQQIEHLISKMNKDAGTSQIDDFSKSRASAKS